MFASKGKMKKLKSLGAGAVVFCAGSLSSMAAAVAPDYSGLVDSGATVIYAAAGVAIVMTGVVVAVRAVRRWAK